MVKHAMTMQPYLSTKCNVSAQVFAQDMLLLSSESLGAI